MSVIIVYCFFFFKQKTAYEMRISDWSSDVCSSDLPLEVRQRHPIIVDDRQMADARRGQILDDRRSQSARPDHRHPRAKQPQLPRAADPLQDDMTGVAVELLVAEIHFTRASRPVEPNPPSPPPPSSRSAHSANRACWPAEGTRR